MNRRILVLLIAVGGVLYLSLKSRLLTEEVPRERLSSTINSEYQEVRPLISADGTRLYFSRRNHPDNTGGAKDFQDIWYSDFQQGSWTTPVRLPEPLNNKKTNTLCSITSDGHYALLLDSYKRVKTPLAQAYDSPAGWGAPGELVIRDFVNTSSYYDFYFYQQSEIILSAIDNGTGYGEQDLHISFKQEDGSYSKPKNLGPVINSKKADFAPFLAADGKTLYFASFGHQGLGGSDFYVCYRLDDSWQRWTTPKNLGPGINSPNDENYLSIPSDFSYVYFESYPEGAKNKDIYRAPLPRQFHPESLAPQATTMPLAGNQNNGPSPEPSQTNMATSVPARPVDRQAVSQKQIAAAKQLREVPLDGQKREIANLPARQYFTDGQVEIRILNNSYFEYNSYQITADCKEKLNDLAKLLIDNPTIDVKLEGHADNWGADEANLRLSYLRAQSAAHYLIDQGVSGNQIMVLAAGEERPLASNDDEKEGRELNRRVEITLMTTPSVISEI